MPFGAERPTSTVIHNTLWDDHRVSYYVFKSALVGNRKHEPSGKRRPSVSLTLR